MYIVIYKNLKSVKRNKKVRTFYSMNVLKNFTSNENRYVVSVLKISQNSASFVDVKEWKNESSI